MSATPSLSDRGLDVGGGGGGGGGGVTAFGTRAGPAMSEEDVQLDRNSIIHLCFGLDRNSEVVQADYSCAIKSRRGGFPLHGRIYVTPRYICFYSNLFGHETKRALPFDEVVGLNGRARFMMRPAVEVQLASGKLYTFGSFFGQDLGKCFVDLRQRAVRAAVVDPSNTAAAGASAGAGAGAGAGAAFGTPHSTPGMGPLAGPGMTPLLTPPTTPQIHGNGGGGGAGVTPSSSSSSSSLSAAARSPMSQASSLSSPEGSPPHPPPVIHATTSGQQQQQQQQQQRSRNGAGGSSSSSSSSRSGRPDGFNLDAEGGGHQQQHHPSSSPPLHVAASRRPPRVPAVGSGGGGGSGGGRRRRVSSRSISPPCDTKSGSPDAAGGTAMAGGADGADDSALIGQPGAPPALRAEQQETKRVVLPCSAQTFFAEFLATGAPFDAAAYQTLRGDTEVSMLDWVRSEIGTSRTIRMRTPIVGAPIGPKSTRVCRTQRHVLYGAGWRQLPSDGSVAAAQAMAAKAAQAAKAAAAGTAAAQHLGGGSDRGTGLWAVVIDHSSQMLDIPYSTYFTVEEKWVVTQLPPAPPGPGGGGGGGGGSGGGGDQCELVMGLEVRFSKSTMWGDRIKKKTMLDVGKANEVFVKHVTAHLVKKAGPGGAAAAAAAAATAAAAAATAAESKRASDDEEAKGKQKAKAAAAAAGGGVSLSCMRMAGRVTANVLAWGSIGFWVALLLLAMTVLYGQVQTMSDKLQDLEASNRALVDSIAALRMVPPGQGGGGGGGGACVNPMPAVPRAGEAAESVAQPSSSSSPTTPPPPPPSTTTTAHTAQRAKDDLQQLLALSQRLLQKQRGLARHIEAAVSAEGRLQAAQNVSQAQLDLATAEAQRKLGHAVEETANGLDAAVRRAVAHLEQFGEEQHREEGDR